MDGLVSDTEVRVRLVPTGSALGRASSGCLGVGGLLDVGAESAAAGALVRGGVGAVVGGTAGTEGVAADVVGTAGLAEVLVGDADGLPEVSAALEVDVRLAAAFALAVALVPALAALVGAGAALDLVIAAVF